MEIIKNEINEGGKIIPIKKKVKVESYMKLSPLAKRIFKSLENRLTAVLELEQFHSEVFAMLCEELATWVLLNKRIQEMNKYEPLSGIIQEFKSGAKNVTAEYAARNTSLKNIINLAKKFGLSISDQKQIGETNNPAQLNIFEVLDKMNQQKKSS